MSTSVSKREPSRLFLTIMLIVIVLLANLAVIIGYRQRNLQSFLAAFADKEMLLQNTPGKRVILVGGSSVAFGFDSADLAQKLGMPVVNMGLQGGLGLRFQLESLKPFLNQGDVVVLSPEYHNLLGKVNSGELLVQILLLYPDTIRYFSTFNEGWQVIRAFPAVHTSAIKNMLEDLKVNHCLVCSNRDPVYYRDAFDRSTGDVMINEAITQEGNPLILNLPVKLGTKDLSESIIVINRFNEYAKDNGIIVYFYFPSSVNKTDENTARILTWMDTELNNQLQTPILNKLEDSQFPPEYMFDTAYHLNWAGDILNTQRLGELLCLQDPDLKCK